MSPEPREVLSGGRGVATGTVRAGFNPLGMVRGYGQLARYQMARALAADPHGWIWSPWAYFQLNMYSTVVGLGLSNRWYRGLPLAVSHAARGEFDKAREILDAPYWRWLPARLKIMLADTLVPFMPEAALRVLSGVRRVPPALDAAVLLRNGLAQRAAALLERAIAGGKAGRWPELYLLQSMALRDSPQAQLQRLNRFLAAFDVPPVALRDDALPPSARNVVVEQDLPAFDGPLVSVLMTTYRSGDWVDVAIESLLRQTYRNIEIIVVDDSSGDATPGRVAQWARRDPRVRLVCLERNGGTYLAKTVGLQQARGDFVTCHDSDDWAHPLKLERQMRPVHPLTRFNPSSPLFRKRPVIERAGAWDLVRTGADSEFHSRLRLVFGKRAIRRVAQPLALASYRTDSLTGSTETGFGDSVVSPPRLAYWEAWNAWHIACLRAGRLPRLPEDSLQLLHERPFTAPPGISVPQDTFPVCG